MTGVRMFAQHLGLDPRGPAGAARPQAGEGAAAARFRAAAAARSSSCVHWGDGRASFGIVFGLLPDADPPASAWSGPVYGLLVWLGFDTVVAPALGLKRARWPHGRERAVFIADHLLFGLVLSELRARPRE